ncbi:MAG: transcriptional activator RfaH [Alphaproteobacteria bacterium]|nr:transcriptional activator RfaH [Alphaproteobacteria bacterium]
MTAWFCAYTQPNRERWARSNLWELGLEVYLPEYRKTRRHARETTIVARPLFPRYLFVRADLEHIPLRRIRSTNGVVDLVSMGPHPSVVSPRIIAELQERQDSDGYIPLGGGEFTTGDAVRIVTTSLCDQIGIFQCATDNDRVIVLLQFLGRNVRVGLDRADIVPHRA